MIKETDNLDSVVDDIITQLKSTTALAKKEPDSILDKENLEAFIIKNSGSLIQKTLDIIDDVKDYISTAPDAKDVAAFAELLKAASSNMEALNKIYISIEKNKNVKEVKKMEIESREKTNLEDNAVFLLSRKEIMNAMIERASEGPPVRNVTPK